MLVLCSPYTMAPIIYGSLKFIGAQENLQGLANNNNNNNNNVADENLCFIYIFVIKSFEVCTVVFLQQYYRFDNTKILYNTYFSTLSRHLPRTPQVLDSLGLEEVGLGSVHTSVGREFRMQEFKSVPEPATVMTCSCILNRAPARLSTQCVRGCGKHF